MIFGCDLGSRRAAVVCPETGFTAVLRPPRRRKREPVMSDEDAMAIRSFIRDNVPPDATLWIEKAIVGQSGNRQTAINLGIANGAAVGGHAGDSWFVLPMVWKAAVIGNGHASKEDIADWLRRAHPALSKACQDDQDLVDAACVGLYGHLAARAILEAPGELPERGGPGLVLRRGRQATDAKRRRGGRT